MTTAAEPTPQQTECLRRLFNGESLLDPTTETTAKAVETPGRDPGWEAVAYYGELFAELAMAEHLYERYNRHGPQLRAIMDELDRVQRSFY